MDAGWSAGGPATGGLLAIAERAGPIVFGGLLVALVLRAIVHQRRYRAMGVLGDDDRDAVHAALAAAERRTVGEILPVVVERSDPHPAADWLAALWVLLVGSLLLEGRLPWEHPALLLASQLVLGSAGFALARALPGFKRLFVFERRATAVAEEQAFQEFYRNGLHRTEAATGVLLFVSLFERRAIVLADAGIDAKVGPAFWSDVDRAIRDEIRRGSLRDGLLAGIRLAGDQLAEHFPSPDGGRNEVPDRLIVRRS